MKAIRAGEKWIGPGHPAFIAAEVGINHNGDLELAKKMIAAAAKAGADAVKFQNYRTEDFLSDRTLTYSYKSQGKQITESQWDMFKRCELRPEALRELKEACDRAGVIFFSTPTSEQGVRELLDIAVPLLKNGSDYLTNLPLLEFMGSTGVPVVISTGMADECDIADAVAATERGGKSEILLLHCTSSYPARPEDTNLARMITLRERFAKQVGFSDHTEGWVAAVQAVTLGATFVEKHFTLDRGLPGPDHWFSSTPEELAELVRNVRLAEQRLGSAELQPASSETQGRREYRLSCVAAHDLRQGEPLRKSDIAFARPGTGIPPRDAQRLSGRRLRRDITRGSQLSLADLD